MSRGAPDVACGSHAVGPQAEPSCHDSRRRLRCRRYLVALHLSSARSGPLYPGPDQFQPERFLQLDYATFESFQFGGVTPLYTHHAQEVCSILYGRKKRPAGTDLPAGRNSRPQGRSLRWNVTWSADGAPAVQSSSVPTRRQSSLLRERRYRLHCPVQTRIVRYLWRRLY